jgi:hypothetical protein
VESSCEFGIEPTGSMKSWESFEWPKQLVASRVVLSSIELVSYVYLPSGPHSLAEFHECTGIQEDRCLLHVHRP